MNINNPLLLATMGNDKGHNHETCQKLLKQCEMFQRVPPNHLATLAGLMDYKILKRNDVLLRQGEKSERFFLLEKGNITRKRLDPVDGASRIVEFAIQAKSINSMKVLAGDPVFATTKCTSEYCKVYEMPRERLLNLLSKKPEIATHIAVGLCEELRNGSKKYATPMLEQQQQGVNIPAVSIAAGIESYYRSALNAMLNTRLTGVKAELFPNMHIQVPARISYICGFKGLRAYFDAHVDPELYEYPTAVRLFTAVSPGIVMTPISSLLEASNAGHMNSEPMSSRMMRGVVPRAGREIVFGIGLNQMSDFFEERLEPLFFNMGGDGDQRHHAMIANAAGSMVAGVVSGYLSHVPHNLSTFKLLEPQSSYQVLFQKFVDKSVPPAIDRMLVKQQQQQQRQSSQWLTPKMTSFTRGLFATLFPRGVMIRTTQIVGSFIILNGTINYLQLREYLKIERALGGGGESANAKQ